MGHPSIAPRPGSFAGDDAEIAPPVDRSRGSGEHRIACAAIPHELPPVAETFRRLGTSPPGRAANDANEHGALSEDELFAIWSARLS